MSTDTNTGPSYVLVGSCPDTLGIVRSLSSFIFELGASIRDSAQFSEPETGRFFFRTEFVGSTKELPDLKTLKSLFYPVADQYTMNWDIHDSSVKPRVMLAVSKFGHCLNDLLFRWSEGALPIDIVGVISNHDDLRAPVEWHGLTFHHLPVSNANRESQEQQILSLITESKADLFVLARYMQILSSSMCDKLAGRAINIHHSFLPGFKGAKPYHQAHARGVKLIGATAHYVTSDLDEGPIIEQDVHRIAHGIHRSELVRLGQEVESRVLARAVKWHCEHRVLLSAQKTIVFN